MSKKIDVDNLENDFSSDKFDSGVHKGRQRAAHPKDGSNDGLDANQGNPSDIAKDIKSVLIFLGILVLIILSYVAYIKYQDSKTFIDPDEMHKANLQGKLSPELGYIYNGFSFIKIDQSTWLTKIVVPDAKGNNVGTVNLQLRYGPNDLEDVKIIGDINYITQFDSAYITFDPTHENLTGIALAAADLTSNLIKALNITPVSACTKNETGACFSRPIISCEKDTEYPIYYLRESTQIAVIADGNCLTIQGPGIEIVKAVDRLVLNWYGVVKDSKAIEYMN